MLLRPLHGLRRLGYNVEVLTVTGFVCLGLQRPEVSGCFACQGEAKLRYRHPRENDGDNDDNRVDMVYPSLHSS